MGDGEEPLRRRFCRGPDCGRVFWICPHCDRGHQYCGDRCRRKARWRQLRAANRRHQQSREGRLDRRDRQRTYRARLRRVTDQTSPAPSDSDSIDPAEPSPSENGSGSASGEARYAVRPEFKPACIICGRSRRRSPSPPVGGSHHGRENPCFRKKKRTGDVRHGPNGGRISRAVEPGPQSRTDAGTWRTGRLDGRERGRRGRDHRGAQWPARRGMAARDAGDILFGSAGKTARRRFPVNSSNRSNAVWRTMKNATEPRQNTLPGGSRGRGSLRVNAIGHGAGRHFGAGWTRPLSGPAWKSGGPEIKPTRNTTRGARSNAPRHRLPARYRPSIRTHSTSPIPGLRLTRIEPWC